jgi:hypothetical protein
VSWATDLPGIRNHGSGLLYHFVTIFDIVAT